MKKVVFITGLVASLFLSAAVFAKAKSAPAPAQPLASPTEQLNYVIKRAGNVDIGVIVKNLNTGQMLFEHNNNLAYVPASNLKVFTAVAALEYLTPEFQFQTYLSSPTNHINQGILSGDLYLVFAGDPSLTRQDINGIFNQLKQRGIHRITGNLYIDDAFFDHDGNVPAALKEDATYCFAAPIASDTIDRNCVGVKARPSPRLGAPAIVNFIQAPDSVVLINQITTGRGRGCNIQVTVQNNNSYLLSGCIPHKSKAQEFSVPVQNMRLYSDGIAGIALKQAKIHLDGRILFGRPQMATQIIAAHQSAPLALLVKHMLKQSDNLYANALLKTLGAHYYKTTGTWQSGTAAVKAILTKFNGVNFTSAVLVDGAGLSRENVITPAQMIQVLTTAYHNPRVAPAFIQALPIGGVDGTLKGRLTEAAYRGRIHAKTGTMTDVSSLSGYVQTHKKQNLAFTIMINDSSPHAGKYRNIEDTICKILILSY